MKAISLWQPWASLWLTPAKIHETRHWPTRHRGPLLVHAAKRKIDDLDGDELHRICVRLFGDGYRATLPRGALLGVVHLTDCLSTVADGPAHGDDLSCGDWSEGRYGWRRDGFETFAPIHCIGRQGLFDVSDAFLLQHLGRVPA